MQQNRPKPSIPKAGSCARPRLAPRTRPPRKDGAVTVGNELPGANQQPTGNAPKDASNKNEETVNYEISHTTRTEVIEGGRLKRLSVAVLVDGLYAKSATGEVSYQPRPQEELDRIAALVRTAIGFDKNAATRSKS